MFGQSMKCESLPWIIILLLQIGPNNNWSMNVNVVDSQKKKIRLSLFPHLSAAIY
jgi:hypothetical protein